MSASSSLPAAYPSFIFPVQTTRPSQPSQLTQHWISWRRVGVLTLGFPGIMPSRPEVGPYVLGSRPGGAGMLLGV